MKKNIIIGICIIIIILIGLFIFIKKDNKADYYYEATRNDNMINYNVKIINGDSLNGNLYNNNGEWLSELINGEAIINEVDIKDYPSFQIKIDDKIYVVKNK